MADEHPLPTDAEIIARFHRLRITIGLSYTRFGYASTGVADQIRRIERGTKLQEKSRRRIAYCLDELEKGHSIPMVVGKKQVELSAEDLEQ